MPMTAMIVMMCGLIAVFLRGGKLHNYLVAQAEGIFRDAGFSTSLEQPEALPGGGVNFVDLLARRGEVLICVEVETTPRNVVSNARKARLLGLPLVVLVPSRKVQRTVRKTLAASGVLPGGKPICVLLLGQLRQAVTNSFPELSAASGERKNRKTNQIRGAGDAC